MEDIKRTGCDETEYIQVPGPMGPQGPRGEQGTQGPQGPQGLQGPKGDQGERGCTGPKGDRGPQGDIGPQGERGLPGLNGRDGARGPEGPRGCKGADGNVMFEDLTEGQIAQLRGPMGPIGPRGGIGPRGPVGPQGATGAQGPRGETGSVGPQGREGVPGPVGPRGPIGPRGERGEPGRGLGHDDIIGESTTWNSKTIAEYALHGKVRWEERRLYQEGIPNTANGFAKDLVVHGKTIHNYITNDDFKEPIITNEEQEAALVRNLYTASPKKPAMQGPGDAGEPTYTFIFDLIVTSTDAGISLGDRIQIEVVSGDNQHTTYERELQEGRNKIDFNIPHGKPTEVNATLFKDPILVPGQAGVNLRIENAMLLAGDYRNKVAPRWFWDTRGVGDRVLDPTTSEKKRQLTIEARNKNLINLNEVITDKYIGFDMEGSRKVWKWKQGFKGDSASFLIYCKQKTYTLTVKFKREYENMMRFAVLGYSDVPSNGEPAKVVYYPEHEGGVDVHGDYIVRNIKVTQADVNVLALYVGNLKTHDGRHLALKDVILELQLEEGEKRTEYEPYRAVTRTMIIPRALMDGDTLEWHDELGLYGIHNEAKPGMWEDTEIKDESFLNTYDGMTYMYVKNKIPSHVTAKFPIKIDGEHIYTKDEWSFRGEEIGLPEDASNFIKFPNGVLMQWRDVIHTFEARDKHFDENFISAKNIIYAHATLAKREGDSQNEGTENFTTFKVQIVNDRTGRVKNSVRIIRPPQQSNGGGEEQQYPRQAFRINLLIISDQRTEEEKQPQPISE